jgi:guanylate kinase
MLLFKRKLFIVFGRSGVGKSSIVREFQERNPNLIKLIVTTTTRPIREGEVDGVNYHFTTRENFERMIAEDKLVEYVEYNGNYYGTTKDEFDYVRDNMIVLEPEGMSKMEELYGKTFIIYKIEIQASDAKVLERLLNRNSSIEEIAKRFRDDKIRFENVDYDVRINSDVEFYETILLFEDLVKHEANIL